MATLQKWVDLSLLPFAGNTTSISSKKKGAYTVQSLVSQQ